jgi:uncharacterized small protein (DUF1192 family)
MSGQPAGNSGYRDEREAALAQVESLRERIAALEPECARLRQENEALRRELAKYAGFTTRPTSSAGTIVVAIVVAVFALLFVAGAASFFIVRKTRECVMPSSVPVPVSEEPVPVSSVAPPSTVRATPLNSLTGT